MCSYIGIDKTKIKAFKVVSIDIEKLKSSKCVTYKEDVLGVPIRSIDGSILSFDYLKITDGYIFNSLKLGVKRNRNIINQYGFIEIHISNSEDRNLRPFTVAEYHEHIERLKYYLESQYGMYIDFSESKFEQIEINITSEMSLQFHNYEYLLNQMVLLVPKRYSLSMNINKRRNINQYSYGNKSVQAKIYDKTNQLKEVHGIDIDKRYMRIEYTLNKPAKIRACIKSEYVYKINDEDIKSWIKEQIFKDLIKPVKKHIDKTNSILREIAQEEINIDCRKWTRNFLNRAMAIKEEVSNGKLALVTDIKQIINIIEMLTSKSNKKRTNSRLKIALSKYSFAIGNFNKLNEIIAKFT